MKIPRLSYWDAFYVLEDDSWRLVTPQELVSIYNSLADRYEVVLADIEEIICGHPSRTDRSVHPGTASTA